MGVYSGCPLSAMLFAQFFGPHLYDFLHSCAFVAGFRSASGRWVLSLLYADKVVLLYWVALGLQLPLHSMCKSFLVLGMLISPTKALVTVFSATATAQALPALGGLAVGSFQNLPASSTLASSSMIWQPGTHALQHGPECCGCLCTAAAKSRFAFV